jgi:hypothetical protein
MYYDIVLVLNLVQGVGVTRKGDLSDGDYCTQVTLSIFNFST